MQSSAVVTLRALVMLVCLVAVPLAAIFGSSLPQAFNALVQGGGLPHFSREAQGADEARNRGGDAPVFAAVPAPTTGNETTTPARRLDGTGSLWAPGALSAAAAGGGERAAAEQAVFADPRAQANNVMPAVNTADAGTPPLSAVARDPRASGEDFQQIERRLRQLGAHYYLLETWGNSGQMYRFHCKVSGPAGPAQSHHFDATDNDPVRAMHKVLAQVEQFRTGQPR